MNEKEWFNKGFALGNLGKWEEALKANEKAIEINPQHVNAWFNKGVALDKLEKPEGAIKAYKQAIKINPDMYTHIAIWEDSSLDSGI